MFSCNKKQLIFIWLIIIYAIIITLIYIFKFGGTNYRLIVDSINILTGLIAIFAGYFSYKYFGKDSYLGKSILFISMSVALFLVADIMWWTFFGEAVVSLSDVFWILGYPMIAIGIYYGVRSADKNFFKNEKKIFSLSIITILVLIIYFIVFPFKIDLDLSFLENLLILAYLVGDLILLVPIIFLVSIILNDKMKKTWILISLGIISIFISDLLYSIHYETYVGGSIIDLGWYYGNIFFSLAFIMMICTGLNKKVKSNSKKK